MDLKSLQCFIAVAERLSFSRAAQHLYISQPSLSIRINALEEELGTKLFLRTHQAVYLTEEGANILPVVRDILEKVYSLPFVVANTPQKEESQSLCVGIDTTEDRTLKIVLAAFSNFHRDFPDVKVRAIDTSVGDYERQLLSGELDCCIMVMQGDVRLSPSLAFLPILQEPTVLVTRDADDMTLTDVLRMRELQLLEDPPNGSQWNREYLSFVSDYVSDIKPSYVSVQNLRINLLYGRVATFVPESYVYTLNCPNLTIFPVERIGGRVNNILTWNRLNDNPAIQLFVNQFSMLNLETEDNNYRL